MLLLFLKPSRASYYWKMQLESGGSFKRRMSQKWIRSIKRREKRGKERDDAELFHETICHMLENIGHSHRLFSRTC